MHNFNLRSLDKPPHGKGLCMVERDEFELITSPNLHCVVYIAHADRQQNKSGPECHHRIIIRMTRGLAPRLKLLHFTGYIPVLEDWRQNPVFPWGDERTGPDGGFRSLVYECCRALPVSLFEMWEEYGNLSRLRNLDMGMYVRPKMGEMLNSMAKKGVFRSLRSLAGGFSEFGNDLEGLAMDNLVQNVPPLEELHLTGSVDRSELFFPAILHCHGTTLRNLHLNPGRFVSTKSGLYWASKIELLAKYCPNIESLRIMAGRSHGEATAMPTRWPCIRRWRGCRG